MATGTTVTHKLLGEAAPYYGNRPLAEAGPGQYRSGGHAQMDRRRPDLRQEVQVANNLKMAAAERQGGAAEKWPRDRRIHRRRLRRYRRHHLDRADHHHPLSVQHSPSHAHNIIAAMAMATPIAHKGVVVGAKAVAMTVLDLMTTPEC